MKVKLEQDLVNKYPNLYKDYNGDPRETCLAWGFECEDGWYNIIDELSSKLEPLGVVAVQVKEKFGGLRFYTENVDSEIYEQVRKYIDEAEIKSEQTCEKCGDPGKRRKGGWIKTLCDKCNE